jgi:hypothetical protein
MSRRTKARAARLYNECNAAAFDVCTIDSVTDESGRQDIGVVLDDFVIVVVAVGIEGCW